MSFIEKAKMIFTNDLLDRICVNNVDDREIVTVDLHGMSRLEGERFVKNIVALNLAAEFVLIVIHGYNSGTVLKETLRKKCISTRIRRLWSPKYNPGITYIEVA